jgi:hypothetical protein
VARLGRDVRVFGRRLGCAVAAHVGGFC